MAGEWLKMECATPDKPEVLALTVRMGWDDPDLTVGKLFRLWRWFDQQTTDGNARGVTAALLDRQVGVTGFIEALAQVGWLTVNADGITLINFDRHNGKTAKERALTAKRVANHRGAGEGNSPRNAQTVTEPLAREEKRREEKTKDAPQPPKGEDGLWETFWTAYPKKEGKIAARKAFAKLNPDAGLVGQMVQALGWQSKREQWTKDGGQFIPDPSTWLNKGRWEDARPGDISNTVPTNPAAIFRPEPPLTPQQLAANKAKADQVAASLGIPNMKVKH